MKTGINLWVRYSARNILPGVLRRSVLRGVSVKKGCCEHETLYIYMAVSKLEKYRTFLNYLLKNVLS